MCFTVPLAIGSFIAFIVASVIFFRSFQSRKWPEQQAELIKAVVEREYDEGWSFWIEISYRYQVDGIEYIGDRLRYLDYASGHLTSIEKQLTRFHKTVDKNGFFKIRYNPNQPENSIVFPGLGTGVVVAIFLSGSIFAVSVLLIYHQVLLM